VDKRILGVRLDALEAFKKEIEELDFLRDKTPEEKKEERDFRVKNFILAVFVKCVRTEQTLATQAFLKGKYEQLAKDWYRCHHLISILKTNDKQWV
jgi:hypothetical protein